MYASKWNLYFDTPEPESKIIMNLLSGSMDLLDTEMHAFLLDVQATGGVQPTDENKDFVAQCLERGYLFMDQQEEQAQLAALSGQWYTALNQKAESITIYPTFSCNLRCVYCFESQKQKGRAGIMSPEMLAAMMRAIDAIHTARGSVGSPMVTIFGGEPLLGGPRQIQLIGELLKALRKRDFHIGVISNGVALPQYAKMLADYGVEILEVTIDGPKPVHDQRRIFANGRGSFDKVVAGIDAALKHRVHVVVRINVDQDNKAHLPELADFITAKGWLEQGVELDLYAVDAAGGENATRCAAPGLEMLAAMFELFDSDERTHIYNLQQRSVRFVKDLLVNHRLPFPQINFCGATAGNKYSFDLFGKIYPCCCMNACELERYNQGEFYPELRLNEDVLSLWSRRNIMSLPRCRECPDALLCGGGCTRLALMSGEALEEGVFCPPSLRAETQLVLNHYYPLLKKELLSDA